MRITRVIIEAEGDISGSAYPPTEIPGCGHGYHAKVTYSVDMETGKCEADVDLPGLAMISSDKWELHLQEVAERCKRLINQ
jgi:hypothetical protein